MTTSSLRAQAKQWLSRWRGAGMSVDAVATRILRDAADPADSEATGEAEAEAHKALVALLGDEAGGVPVAEQSAQLCKLLLRLARRQPLLVCVEDGTQPGLARCRDRLLRAGVCFRARP